MIAAIFIWLRHRKQHPDKPKPFSPDNEPELKQKIPEIMDKNDSNLKSEASNYPVGTTGFPVLGSEMAVSVNPFVDPNISSHQSVCSDESNKDTLYPQSTIVGYPQMPPCSHQQPIYIPVYMNHPSQIPQQYGTEFFPGLYEMPVSQHYIDSIQQANLTDSLDKVSA